MNRNSLRSMVVILFLAVLLFSSFLVRAEEERVFTPQDIFKTKLCNETQISPNGQWIAYTVNVSRTTDDTPGPVYKELHLISLKNRKSIPFIAGKISISSIQWSPDSSRIGFLMKRGDNAKNQVWAIPVEGGEAVQLSRSENDVIKFHWHPLENKIAYLAAEMAATPEEEKKIKDKEKKLKDKGFDFIYYEENLKHQSLYMQELSETNKLEALTRGVTIDDFMFSPDGKTIAAMVIKLNLVDHEYMFKKIHILDLATKKLELLIDTPGKLGSFSLSPDGKMLAYAGALDQKDHDTSQLFVVDTITKQQKNLTIPKFRGHITWVGWKDAKTVVYIANEGVWSTLNTVPALGGTREIIMDSSKTGIGFDRDKLNFTVDFKSFAFTGTSDSIPADVFYWKPGLLKPDRLTVLNDWLKNVKLGKQEPFRYKARDGLEIEGILVYPVDYREGTTYPLIVDVHGGPESTVSQKWLTRYSMPIQVLAGKGYVVFLPNYRASSGYGYDFAIAGYKDPAGKEFDDIADGIDYLVNKGIADKDRVGLGGGSYGGYAAAWFATYYTKYVRAVCMFVGISDLISKRGSTDIPYEELYVHSGEKLENMWDLALKRSPIYWAHQSKTATLIVGGANDPRVHPTQSMELYRMLKMNNHPAVRLVQYPGEEHGNKRLQCQMDLVYRMIQWYDWYVKDKKPIDGGMPELDISSFYGIF